MPIKTDITQAKNNATLAASNDAELAEMNESFLERNRVGLTRAVGYSQVPLLIASLGLSSKLFHAIGYQTDKYLGVDPFKNPGLAFFAVAKSAGWATESLQKFLYSRLGYIFPKTPAQILFRAMPFGNKIIYGFNELFREGKLLTYLPLAGFHMGGGFAVSNLVDHYLGDSLENLTNKDVREIAVTSAFFYKEIFASIAPSAPVRYLASTTAGKAFGTFMNTAFTPAMAPVRIVAGLQFGYDLASGTINMFLKGSAQANYDYLLAMDAAKEHSSFTARILTPVADTYHTTICSGSGIGMLYDGYESFKVFVGLEDENATCEHLRNVYHEKYSGMVFKQLPIIKETFREAITFAGLGNPYGEADAQLWRKLISEGWLEQVDTKILQNSAAFTEQAFHSDPFRGGNFLLQFGTFAAVMDSLGAAEWFRKYFDYDMLYGRSKELELGLVLNWPIIKEELTDDFIISLGTSRGRILETRMGKFAHDVAKSLTACLAGTPSMNQLVMRELAIELGFADKDGFPTDNFIFHLDSFTKITLSATPEELKTVAGMTMKLAEKYRQTKELRFALSMIATAPHVAIPNNAKQLGTALKVAADVLEMHAASPVLLRALMPVYEKLQNTVVGSLVRQAVADKIIDSSAKMVQLDVSDDVIRILKDCSVIEQLLKTGDNKLKITDICNEDGSINSTGEAALEKFVGTLLDQAVKSFTLEKPRTELEEAVGKELRAEESNNLLKELRLQVGAIYITCLANAELFGKNPTTLFAETISGKEYKEVRENMKLAAAFWKGASSPKDFKWRTFTSGAINPDGSIGNIEELIEWGLEAKKDAGSSIIAELNSRLTQAKSILDAFDRGLSEGNSGYDYLSDYLQGEVDTTKNYIEQYKAQFCAASSLATSSYDPIGTFFMDGVDCLTGDDSGSADEVRDELYLLPADEARLQARFSLDIVRELDQKLAKLETELELLKKFESDTGIKFSFHPRSAFATGRNEIGREVAESNLKTIERTLRKMDATINEPELSKAIGHLKKAFMLK